MGREVLGRESGYGYPAAFAAPVPSCRMTHTVILGLWGYLWYPPFVASWSAYTHGGNGVYSEVLPDSLVHSALPHHGECYDGDTEFLCFL